MKKLILTTAALLATVLITAYAKEKMDHSKHSMNHGQHSMKQSQHQPQNKPIPKEVGEAGFAAIAEIVSMLVADPKTDWSKVDIDSLRGHLVLMNSLVTGAKVQEQAIPSGVRFNVTGSKTVLSAVQQMVPAHAAELNKMAEFTVTTKAIEDGVALIVTGQSKAVEAKIKGLGFFGLMATGSHHQMHHLAMARGQGHHNMSH